MKKDIQTFQSSVWQYYHEHYRPMPWREDPSGYYVLVSEIMLQQTQVPRVMVKFEEFMTAFPTIHDLADAPLSQVLTVWKGLGYNRRAKFLHEAAKQIVTDFDSQIPNDHKALVSLKGIGPNTAGAIQAYVYNEPVIFIETNIRRVFIHHFFKDRVGVEDKELLPFIKKALPQDNPREWYWALMDYGTYLKTIVPNPNRRSKHYTKQSKFEGSRRQLRAQLLDYIVHNSGNTLTQIERAFPDALYNVRDVLADLQQESLIYMEKSKFYIQD
jgi:A/G-specific adenine glycosylase